MKFHLNDIFEWETDSPPCSVDHVLTDSLSTNIKLEQEPSYLNPITHIVDPILIIN